MDYYERSLRAQCMGCPDLDSGALQPDARCRGWSTVLNSHDVWFWRTIEKKNFCNCAVNAVKWEDRGDAIACIGRNGIRGGESGWQLESVKGSRNECDWCRENEWQTRTKPHLYELDYLHGVVHGIHRVPGPNARGLDQTLAVPRRDASDGLERPLQPIVCKRRPQPPVLLVRVDRKCGTAREVQPTMELSPDLILGSSLLPLIMAFCSPR